MAAIAAVFALAAYLPETAPAANVTWTGGGNATMGSNWSGGNGNNWAGGSAPLNGDALFFNTSTKTTNTNNITGGSYLGIGFLSTAGAFTIGGNALTLTSGSTLTNLSTSTQTLNLNIALGLATGTIAATNGNFTLGGVLSGTNITFTGRLTTLSGANTFTGVLTAASGTVRATTSAAALGAGTLTLGGGSVELANDTGLNFGRNTTVSTSGTIFSERLTAGVGQTHTLGTLSIGAQTLTLATDASVTSGTAGLTFGAVTLSANGASFVSGGTNTLLTLGAISGAGNSFTVSGSGNTTISGAITTTTGGLTKDGPGALTLSASNSFTGTTTLTGGSLVLGDAGGLFNSTLAVGGGTLSFGSLTAATLGGLSGTGNVALANAASQAVAVTTGGNNAPTSYSGTLSGGGSLTKAGTGTLTLSAANTYTGVTNVSAGVLNVQNAAALGTTAGGVAVSSGAALELQGGITVGAEALSLAGTGVSSGGALRNVSGTNTYQGLLTLTAATEIQSDAGLLSLSNSGTITGAGFGLTVDGAGDTSIAGVIGTTTGGLTKNGAGRLTLTGANTYGGATIVNSGTLLLGASNVLSGSTAVTVAGGVLDNGGANTAASFTISGGAYTGTGTLTAGTYALQGGTISAGLGSGAIATTGNATLSATAAASSLQVNSGTFTVSSANLLSGLPVVTGSAGAVLSIGGSQTVGSIAGGADLALGANTLTTGGGNSSTSLSGVVTGAGNLVKVGTGTFTLSGNNSFSGTTSINVGAVSVASVAPGAVSQALGTGARVNLGASGSSSGWLVYTGVSGTLSKNVFALGNGSDTIENAGTGPLTLTGTLTKEGTVLRLQGGSQGIAVSGPIVGGIANSDLAVQSGLTTLSGTNTYVGPTFVNSSGTLALGIANAIPANSAVTIGGTFAGGNGGAGTLSTGTFTSTIGSLGFAGAGGTIRLTPTLSQTSTLMLSATGAVNLTGTSTLDLGNTALTAGVYRLVAGSSLTGTFATLSNVDANYLIRYGLNPNSVDAQRKANQDTTFTLTTGTVTRVLVNTDVTLSGTVTNTTTQAGASSLTLGLAATGLTGSGFTTGSVGPNASTAVSGTLNAGLTVGSRTWTVLNTDATAITTTSTAGGSLTVVSQRSFAPTSGTIALGRYLITATPTGTTGISSSGLSGTTANATLGTFSSENGLSLTLTSGSANFAGAAASQTAGYAVSGTATSAGNLSGSFSSAVTPEFGTIGNVVVNYTANPVNQRTFSTGTSSTLALGFVHQGGALGTPTATVSSNGLAATTGSATLGTFTGGPSGLSLNLSSGVNTNVFSGTGASQAATYTLSGSTGSAGAINGTFTSSVTGEFAGIPNVTVAVTGTVYSGQSTWITTTSGTHSWGTFTGTGSRVFGANWGSNQGSPGLDGAFANTDTARFGSALSSGTAVILLNGAGPSLRSLTFDNSTGTYDLDVGTGGTGRITLQGSGSNGLIDVQSGFHEIHTELALASNLTVSVASASGLILHGDIAGAGFSLTKSGAGLLTVRGNNDYFGGTLVTGGTLTLGNSGTPLGSGTVVLSNGATLNLQGFAIANVIDSGNGTIVNPGAANIDISGNTTISGTTPVAGVYTVLAGGTATIASQLGGPTAATVNVDAGGTLVTTGTITDFGSVLVKAAGRATLSGPVNGSVTTAGSTTFGGDLLGLGTVLVTGGTTTFQGTTFGDVNVGTSGTGNLPKTAIFNGTIAKTAHVYASGTIDILGSVAATGDVKIEAGGVARMLGTGTFGQEALTNNGSFVIDRSGSLTLAAAITGSGGLRKLGSSTLTLTGTSGFSGLTQVDAGKLVVNGRLGTGGVSVATGGALAGSGVIAGAIGGGGLVEPGNSPGILTAGSLAATGTTSFAFEFTGTAAPVWSNAAASGNDVLRLTDPTSPFAGSLAATNLVSVYFDVASIAGRSEFLGGFYTDKDASFAGLVAAASYVYYVKGDGNGTATTYNGQGYYSLDAWGPTNIYDYRGVTRTTVQVASANFESGVVTDGWSTQFIVVPEPETLLLAGCGLLTACGGLFRRRRFRTAA